MRPIRKGQEERQRKPPLPHLQGGVERECVDGNAKNRSSATTLARGGEAKLDRRKREHKKSHSPVPQSE